MIFHRIEAGDHGDENCARRATKCFSGSGTHARCCSRGLIERRTTFSLSGHKAQYYVVWLTELPPGNRAEISEVTATS